MNRLTQGKSAREKVFASAHAKVDLPGGFASHLLQFLEPCPQFVDQDTEFISGCTATAIPSSRHLEIVLNLDV